MLKNVKVGRQWTKIADASEVFTATFGGANQVEVAPSDTEEPPTLRGHTIYPDRPKHIQVLNREIIGPGHVYVKNTGNADEILCVVTSWMSMR